MTSTDDIATRHIGRSFADTHLEDKCPCPKAPCGLVPRDQVVEQCGQHHWTAAKTIRQSHPADQCPGAPAEPDPLTDQQVDEIETRAASLYEYATLTDQPLQADADQLTGEDVPALLAEVRRLRARVTDLEAAPATVPPAYELATRAHLGAQLREVLGRCAKRANEAEQPLRRDLIARGMGLLSALHLVEEGSADNTEQDGEFAGYDEDADPPGGFPDEPIPYSDPTGLPADTLLVRRGIRPAPVAAVVSSAAGTPGSGR